MGRNKDLSDFDILMARRLGQSISEKAMLVGCSHFQSVVDSDPCPLSKVQAIESELDLGVVEEGHLVQ